MSDDKQRNSNGSEPRSGGNVWFVLIAIVSAVLLSAFLFGGSDMRLRYPDLMKLLAAMAEARQADSDLVPLNDQGNPETNLKVDEAGAGVEDAASAEGGTDAVETETGTAEADGTEAKGTEAAGTEATAGDATKSDSESVKSGSAEDETGSKVGIDPKVTVIVSSTKSLDYQVEFGGLEDVRVADGEITGKVAYRARGIDNKGPVGAYKMVEFKTIRDTNNEAAL